MNEHIVDLSDHEARNLLFTHLRTLRGKYRFEITKYYRRRTDDQNRYYWGIVVALYHEWLEDQGYRCTPEEAHEDLKKRFLTKPIIRESDGEIYSEIVASSATLTTKQFWDYIEEVAQWLAEFCGIVVPDPTPYKTETTNTKNNVKHQSSTA